MNMHKLKLVAFLFVLAVLAPSSTHAYFTTTQSATKLTDTTVLFTISYKFGFAERDVYMPIIAKRDLAADTPALLASYSILDDGEVVDSGVANALILTNNSAVSVKDNQYFVPAGHSATFTLVALATVPAETLATTPDLSLLVTQLPFVMVTAEGKQITAQLNPSELQYYHTPKVEL